MAVMTSDAAATASGYPASWRIRAAPNQLTDPASLLSSARCPKPSVAEAVRTSRVGGFTRNARAISPKRTTPSLGELEPRDFLDIQPRLLEAGNAAGTADRVLALCRYICNCAIRWKTPGIKTDPTADVPLLHADNTTQRFLSSAETGRLIATLDKPPHRKIKTIVRLLSLTGGRRGEVLNRRFDKFVPDQRVLRMDPRKQVRASAHCAAQPLSQAAVDPLGERRIEALGPFVCPTPQTGRPYVQVHYAWKRACREASLPGLCMPDLRYSFTSFLV